PEEYLNDWYMNILEKEPSLTKRNFASIIKEIGQEADTDKLVRNIFHFVQAKIKYIDIENGLNAFVPRDPNFVLENKQGDCKDMAFLIYSILKGCGIKSNLALAASITHSFDVDFPSVASANH